MKFICISTNFDFFTQLKSLLSLALKDSSSHIMVKNSIEFSRQNLAGSSCSVFIDCKSVGCPDYPPFNMTAKKDLIKYYLVNCASMGEREMLHYLKSGFSGVIFSDEKVEIRLKAITSIIDGQNWFPRRVVEAAISEYQNSSMTNEQIVMGVASAFALSKREQQVCLLLIDGVKNSEIARRLFISTHTVKCHVTSLYRKLGVHRRADILKMIHEKSSFSQEKITDVNQNRRSKFSV